MTIGEFWRYLIPSAPFSIIVLFFSLFSSPTFAGSLYTVTNVASDDVLNVRANPTAKARIVGAIPPNEKNVEVTGSEVSNSGTLWVPITYRNLTGWANAKYLVTTEIRTEVTQAPSNNVPVVNQTSTPTTSTPAPHSQASEVASSDSAIDKCVDQYVHEYRAWAEKELGMPDKPARGDELEQWTSWCREGKTSSFAYSDGQEVWPQKKSWWGCDFTIRDKKTMEGWRKAGSALGSKSEYAQIEAPICDKSRNREVQINGYSYNSENDTYNFDVYLNSCASIYRVFDEPGTEKFKWVLWDIECEKSNSGVHHAASRNSSGSVQGQDQKNNCLAQTKYGETQCYSIRNEDLKNNCLAQTKYGESQCYSIGNEDLKNNCLAQTKYGESQCYSIGNEDLKNNCLAQTKYGVSQCYSIGNENLKNSCLAQTKYGESQCYSIR